MRRSFVIIFALALMGALAPPPAALGATYTVSSTQDVAGACTGLVCPSLRAAVTDAQAGSTIALGAATYSLLTPLSVQRDEVIQGQGPGQTSIQQTGGGDVLESKAGALTLIGLTVTGGHNQPDDSAPGFASAAGAIYASGTGLTLQNVSVSGNRADGVSATAAGGAGTAAVGAIQTTGAATLNIDHSTIALNSASAGGGGPSSAANVTGGPGEQAVGAILSGGGNLTITDTTIALNQAIGGSGGGSSGSGGDAGAGGPAVAGLDLENSSDAVVRDSTLASNRAAGGTGGSSTGSGHHGGVGGPGSGAVRSLSLGALSFTGTTLSANTASGGRGGSASGGAVAGNGGLGEGGALDDQTSNAGSLVNDTINSNAALGGAGGLGSPSGSSGPAAGGGVNLLSASLDLASDTISANSVSGPGSAGGGQLAASGATFSLRDTILAGAAGPNCHIVGTAEMDYGHNLESDFPSSCGFSAGHADVLGADPMLQPLGDNGGATLTQALAPTSAARFAGGMCVDPGQGGGPLGADQRGAPRSGTCDIGAFQSEPPRAVTPPGISGTYAFGRRLTCTPGTWAADGSLSFAYAWLRGGVSVPGASGSTYLLGASDFGPRLACRVIATGIYGRTASTASVASPATCNCVPRLTRLGQSHRHWRLGRLLARLSRHTVTRHRPTPPPVGTTFSFVLDRGAAVRLTFLQTVTGRRVGSRCVRSSPGARGGGRCTLELPVAVLKLRAHRGRDQLRFQGRLSQRRMLPPGPYRLRVTANLPGAPSSPPAFLSFTILPR